MKSSEFTKRSGQRLFEALNKTNDTPVSTQNLVRIVEAHRENVWSEPVSGDDYLKNLMEGKLQWQKIGQ
jgi:hypothetical protein